MQRSAEEIKARCNCILNDEDVINLVKVSSSPSATYEMVLAKTNDISKAKAGRWLSVLRRDYPAEYFKLIPINPSHVQSNKAQTEKENVS